MCVQLDSLFTCGHRSFKRFDNCAQFGLTCLGAGPNHTILAVARICDDCKTRDKRYPGTTPGEASLDSGEGGSREMDPWAEGDPWKKKRKKR